jgi:hypothetical protein
MGAAEETVGVRAVTSSAAPRGAAAGYETFVRTPARSDVAVLALAVVSLVWIGVLLGVSFLATPVKFLAPSLTLPVALDVGRQTFQWLNRVEILFALAALATTVAYDMPVLRRGSARGESGPERRANDALPYATLLASILLVAVAAQALWLLPMLDGRVEIIMQGAMPPPSWLHDAYVIVEAIKLGALVGGAWLAIAALRGRLARSGGADAHSARRSRPVAS